VEIPKNIKFGLRHSKGQNKRSLISIKQQKEAIATTTVAHQISRL
jgi:hypothetical protein